MATSLRKLAIVGASARAAAFSAIRAGFEVVAADLFADADLARICAATRVESYPDGLVDWLAASDCDAWMYTGALENYPDLVDRMAALRPLLGNAEDALRGVRDPFRLQAALAEAGIAFPETRSSADGLPFDGSWLCKTYRGASGSGVWRLDGAAALDRAHCERAVFQQFVPGESAAAVFALGAKGAQPLGMTRQRLGNGANREWQYHGSLGPIPRQQLSPRWLAQLADLGPCLANTFGLRGLVGVDLILGAERLWVIEVNPRYTASVEILERATKQLAIAIHVEACLPSANMPMLQPAPPTPDQSVAFFAKSILFANRDVTINRNFYRWASVQSLPEFDRCQLADIPGAGEMIPAGRPVLTIFAEGQTEADCGRRLANRLAEVAAQLYRGN